MAAPTVKQKANTVRNRKKDNKSITVKNVLFSPYAPEWPVVAVGETPKILQEITRTFDAYKILPNMKKKKSWTDDRTKKTWTTDSLERVEEGKKRKAVLRSHVVFGVNLATKALEQGQLDLVIVCRSAPPIMTSHLMTLAVCRGVPALALSGLCETVAKMIRANSVIALGFKKCSEIDNLSEEFAKLAAFIKERAPPIKLPWLEYKDIPLETLRQQVVEASKGRIKGKAKHTAEDTTNRAPLQLNKSILPSVSSDPSAKPMSSQTVKGSEIANMPQKRSSEEAGLDGENSRKVSKVTYVSGKTKLVRSVPQEMKQEWKKTKKSRKKKKKSK